MGAVCASEAPSLATQYVCVREVAGGPVCQVAAACAEELGEETPEDAAALAKYEKRSRHLQEQRELAELQVVDMTWADQLCSRHVEGRVHSYSNWYAVPPETKSRPVPKSANGDDGAPITPPESPTSTNAVGDFNLASRGLSGGHGGPRKFTSLVNSIRGAEPQGDEGPRSPGEGPVADLGAEGDIGVHLAFQEDLRFPTGPRYDGQQMAHLLAPSKAAVPDGSPLTMTSGGTVESESEGPFKNNGVSPSIGARGASSPPVNRA